MAYYSWKDIADVTYNSSNLKAYVTSISGLKVASVKEEWRAAGAAAKTVNATGMYDYDPVVIDFIYEDSASGPNAKCAQDTSATLTVTFITGQSVTGTAIVTEREVVVGPEGDNHLVVTFEWTGGATYDTTA